MFRSPVAIVFVKGGREITHMIEDFTYEDSLVEDNMLELKLKSDFTQDLSEDEDLIAGAILEFYWGYIGLEPNSDEPNFSPVHYARIRTVAYNYAERVTIDIRAVDMGNAMSNVNSKKVWTNVTSEEIVKAICARHSLTPIVDKSTRKWDNLPQGNRTDKQLLQWMSTNEYDGNFIVYNINNEVHYVRRGTNLKPYTTFTYGNPNSHVISFNMRWNEVSDKGDTLSGTGSDPEGTDVEDVGEGDVSLDYLFNTYSVNSDQISSLDKANQLMTSPELGQFQKDALKKAIDDVHLANKERMNLSPITNAILGGKPEKRVAALETAAEEKLAKTIDIVTPYKTKAENKGFVDNKTRKAKLLTLTADLVIEGNPVMVADAVITVNGLTKRHNGNWYVEKVVHTINSGGYITTLDINKDGNKDYGTDDGITPNDKPSAEDAEEARKITVGIYDEESEEIAARGKPFEVAVPFKYVEPLLITY